MPKSRKMISALLNVFIYPIPLSILGESESPLAPIWHSKMSTVGQLDGICHDSREETSAFVHDNTL
jgi:hypothetical protein